MFEARQTVHRVLGIRVLDIIDSGRYQRFLMVQFRMHSGLLEKVVLAIVVATISSGCGRWCTGRTVKSFHASSTGTHFTYRAGTGRGFGVGVFVVRASGCLVFR